MTQNGEESELLLKKKQISGQRILSFLGLAAKARKTVSGTDAVMQAVSCGGAYLVIAAEDASEGTAKKAAFAAREAGVSFCRFSTRDQLGKYLGKTDRAVAAVIDKGFADRLIQLLQDGFEVTKGE